MTETHVRLPDDVAKAVWAYTKQDERTFNKEVIVLLREALAARKAAETTEHK